MSNNREATEKMLIEATVECIEKYGLKKTTIRNIATQANVNSSAISYYFKSRTELLKKAMLLTIDNAINISDVAILESDSYPIVLEKILLDWYQGAMAYQGVTKAHFEDLQNKLFVGDLIVEKINQFIKDIYKLLLKHGMSDSEENKTKLNIIFGIFIGNLTMPQVSCYNLAAPDTESFINQLIDFI